MSKQKTASGIFENNTATRRDALKLAAGAAITTGLYSTLGASAALAAKTAAATNEAFVYTELQASVPFEKAPWSDLNKVLLKQPGLVSKTWLAGLGNNSLGGLYTFKTFKDAIKFVTEYFPGEAQKFGVAHTTRIFDAQATKEASLELGSPHYGLEVKKKPGAFVYTEVQVSADFNKVPWKERNPVLKKQKGLMSKTWLSGLNSKTVGGFDTFDTLENAKNFAINDFPKVAKKMQAAFYTRIFEANVTEAASREMKSPFYK